MNCTTAQNHWHAQQDGELSIEQQAALTSHLTGCAVCRAYIADLEAVTGALAELRDASSGHRRNRNRGITAPHRLAAPSAPNEHLRGGRIAATIALVLGAGLVTWRSLPPESSRELGSPVPTALPPQPARVALLDASADAYIPVERSTRQPRVHLFVLFNSAESTGPGAD
jgi:hypothetical protein